MAEIPEDKPEVARHRRSLRGALANPDGPSFPDEDALRDAIERAWEIELRLRYAAAEGANQMSEPGCPKCGGYMDQGSIVSEFRYAPSVEQSKPFALRSGLRIPTARACTECGFLELFVEAERLRKNLRG